MVKAVFPGSFDPPTLGHLNLIERGASIYDELVVVIAENRQKKYLFPAAERLALMKELVKPWKNVSVLVWEGLLADFMRDRNLRILLRGVRGTGDFSYEFELSLLNRTLNREIETVFMGSAPEYIALSSSAVKELASFGGDISALVAPPVAEALKKINDSGP